MPAKEQLKAVILEECVLYLLQRSGYRTVLECGIDPSLAATAAGLGVRGRGSVHQIDAIADFTVTVPFSHPNRLLVETKCYEKSRPVGLAVIRNAVGVLKDVNEFWTEATGARQRHHYTFAVFSTSPFTREAQAYAYAQDVYLLPLGASAFLGNLLHVIDRAADHLLDESVLQRYRDELKVPGNATAINIALVRSILRHVLQPLPERGFVPPLEVLRALDMVLEFLFAVRGLYLGTLRGGLPVVLTPPSTLKPQPLNDNLYMRVVREKEGWLLVSVPDESVSFSFDLPPELFLRFIESGVFAPVRYYDGEWMHVIDMFETTEEHQRAVRIWLQRGWEEPIAQWAKEVRSPSEEAEGMQ